MIFENRHHAGHALAEALRKCISSPAIVYALPRGGVPIGVDVARALKAPLELIIPRKIGHPFNPEYGVCAVTESGALVCNEAERARLDTAWLEARRREEVSEAQRRRERYGCGHTRRSARDATAVVVDDGIATGLTMLAAVRDIRAEHPAQLIVAVPVAPRDTIERFEREVDRVVAVYVPEFFRGAIGAYYEDFSQLSDEDVLAELASLDTSPTP